MRTPKSKSIQHVNAALMLAAHCLLVVCSAAQARSQTATSESSWVSLFNGRNLDGWIPKINHQILGKNYLDTFTVRDGAIRVSYDKYKVFNDEFAHLIYRSPFSSYRLRLDYRFFGSDTPGAPSWAAGNSGVMIFGQPPETIGLDQPFPVSIEVQLLNNSTTGNVCTPGTSIKIEGAALQAHCSNSTSRPFAGERWVHLEIEVKAGRLVTHRINGEVVLKYEDPELDPVDLRAMEIYFKAGQRTELNNGYISLQGEGHPIEFRNIEIMKLPD
jgi:hypothetical protein